MPDIQLRSATADDFDFLWNLHAATMREAVDAVWGWDDDWQFNYFQEKFAPHERQIIVIDGMDAGTLGVEQRPDEIFVAMIAVAPAHQNQGIGTTILRQLLADAHANGFPVTLHCLRSNLAARRLYERLDFRVYDEDEERFYMVAEPG